MAGRPRSPDVDAALTAATAELLAETGYTAMTVGAVALRAGIPKSTIYRRWSSKAELVFATVVHRADISVPDTGALTTDLLELARRILAALDGPQAQPVLPGLLADLAADSELMSRFRQDVIGAERALVQSVLDRAVVRGELTGRVDAADLHAQLLGTAFAWTVVIGDPLPTDLAERLATAAHAVLIPRGTP